MQIFFHYLSRTYSRSTLFFYELISLSTARYYARYYARLYSITTIGSLTDTLLPPSSIFLMRSDAVVNRFIAGGGRSRAVVTSIQSRSVSAE